MVQNRLYHVNETVAVNAFNDDIDDQGGFSSTNVNTTNNYGYDGEGRLIRDDAEEIASIKWTVTGKVKEVNRTSGSTKKNLKFRYDGMGQRIAKEVYDSQNNWEKTTFYVRDPQGNVMAIYDKTTNAQSQQISYKVTERDVYGSSRVGMNTIEVELIGATSVGNVSTHVVGKKQYEVSNHLVNVLSIVTDKVLAKNWDNDNVVDYFRAEIMNASDYTPFGVQMDGRKFVVDDYRYGFNGTEKDPEDGFNTTKFRQYDSRLGRWLSKDPVVKPWESPYVGFANNPIWFVDPSGLDTASSSGPPTDPKQGDIYKKTEKNGTTWTYTYDQEAGWIGASDANGNSGNIVMKEVEIVFDKETGQPVSSSTGSDNWFIDMLKRGDRFFQGHSKWSFGTSMNGEGQTGNPLAPKATTRAKLFTYGQEDLILHSKQQQTWKGVSYNGQNGRLTEGLNGGYASGNNSYNQAPMSDFDVPVLGTKTDQDVYQDVRENIYTLSDGQSYITLTYWVTPELGTTGQHSYPANPHNIELYRTGSPVYLSEIDLTTPAIQ
jgi:RHS repeat-associated protein